MPGSSRRTLATSAPRVLLILASVGLACEAHATPIELSTEEREAASPLLAPPGIEVDPGSVFTVEAGEDFSVERFDSLLPEASGDAAARPRDAGSSGYPGPSPSALTQHQLDLARRQAQEGNFEAASASLERALEVDPGDAETHAQLGFALIPLGRFAEAERQLMRAIELGARSAPVYAALAQAAKAQGRPSDAIRHGREALRVNPNLVPVANNLAWLLATCADPSLRDPEEAIRLAQGALRAVSGEPPWILDTLATGYAAAGRYDDAIRTAEKAEALALKRDLPDLAREIRKHLDLYRAGEPYVEP
jgi:tetratricopeptide (TPR) repeat protein